MSSEVEQLREALLEIMKEYKGGQKNDATKMFEIALDAYAGIENAEVRIELMKAKTRKIGGLR